MPAILLAVGLLLLAPEASATIRSSLAHAIAGATTTSHAEKTVSLEDVEIPSKAPDAVDKDANMNKAKDIPESIGEATTESVKLANPLQHVESLSDDAHSHMVVPHDTSLLIDLGNHDWDIARGQM